VSALAPRYIATRLHPGPPPSARTSTPFTVPLRFKVFLGGETYAGGTIAGDGQESGGTEVFSLPQTGQDTGDPTPRPLLSLDI
jgi:hypothetical protein